MGGNNARAAGIRAKWWWQREGEGGGPCSRVARWLSYIIITAFSAQVPPDPSRTLHILLYCIYTRRRSRRARAHLHCTQSGNQNALQQQPTRYAYIYISAFTRARPALIRHISKSSRLTLAHYLKYNIHTLAPHTHYF